MSKEQQGSPATADICDAMGDEATVCETAFRDFGAKSVFSGTIVTVATFEDNLNLREVLAGDGAGKVLVVDGGASKRRALVGGNVAQLAAEKGWAGLIINGCVRDAHEIADAALGVKAIGTNPRRPLKNGIGTVGEAVKFGGVTFRPGECVYADGDAVVVTARPFTG
ncbi:MAG TPA: ribonuclease E activity regulator RraA [Rhodospirillales bacterium]|nr:ribonuclease E activity regulator RraA [Rhodospirillales bacterium]HJO68712.1 ribonuclease E activity regulator RraA [Rhodospirillales bacterium]